MYPRLHFTSPSKRLIDISVVYSVQFLRQYVHTMSWPPCRDLGFLG